MFAGLPDGVADVGLGGGPFHGRLPEGADCCDVALVCGVRFVVLESLGQLVSVGEDIFDGSGHRHHLRYFSRALIAWKMTFAVWPSMTPTSKMIAVALAPMIIVKPSSRSKMRMGLRYACRMSSSLTPCLKADGAMMGSSAPSQVDLSGRSMKPVVDGCGGAGWVTRLRPRAQ